MKKTNYIYSSSLGKMVVKSFIIQKIGFLKNGGMRKYKPHQYIWNDLDCVYYEKDSNKNCYTYIPKNGKKVLSLKNDEKYKRLLVTLL